ncbi:unnamed protein product [Phytophthora fragariaefolia]|uniref:Unnamed protein product n=1 Tax=Phytophthora fragariaefolia TaxID=1490495 RepID=A0A9W6U5V8_9STRA|nr:unnamed protein product [Phytophthora fragariaefolia]
MKDEPKWIAFLDPRIAGQMSHLNNVEKQQAIEDHISTAAKLSGERIPTQQATSSTTSPPDDDFMTTYLFGKKRRKYTTTSVITSAGWR